MKKILLLLLLSVAAVVAHAESNPISSAKYKWRNAPLTNGRTAVIKQDYYITDHLKPGHNIAQENTARMFVERVMLNGRKAIRIFEIHGWPVCPTDGSTCMVIIQKVKYRSSSSNNFERGQLYRGAAKVGKNGDGYITNMDMVDLIWTEDAFSINTNRYADYNKGLDAFFSERGGENATVLKNDSDAGFDKMDKSQWTGVVQNTTDGAWADMKRSAQIRKVRAEQQVLAAPRIVTLPR